MRRTRELERELNNKELVNRLFIVVLIFSSSMLAQTVPGAKPSSPDYSGMYSFLQEGEFLQLTVEDNGIVTGLVSRFSDAGSDHTAFVEHFFAQGKLAGNDLSFTTKIAQGLSYEFKGTIERGEGKTPQDQAYYVLRGTLTENKVGPDKKTTSESQQVEFKSFPRDPNADTPK